MDTEQAAALVVAITGLVWSVRSLVRELRGKRQRRAARYWTAVEGATAAELRRYLRQRERALPVSSIPPPAERRIDILPGEDTPVERRKKR